MSRLSNAKRRVADIAERLSTLPDDHRSDEAAEAAAEWMGAKYEYDMAVYEYGGSFKEVMTEDEYETHLMLESLNNRLMPFISAALGGSLEEVRTCEELNRAHEHILANDSFSQGDDDSVICWHDID